MHCHSKYVLTCNNALPGCGFSWKTIVQVVMHKYSEQHTVSTRNCTQKNNSKPCAALTEKIFCFQLLVCYSTCGKKTCWKWNFYGSLKQSMMEYCRLPCFFFCSSSSFFLLALVLGRVWYILFALLGFEVAGAKWNEEADLKMDHTVENTKTSLVLNKSFQH